MRRRFRLRRVPAFDCPPRPLNEPHLSALCTDAEGVARKLEAATLVKEKFEAFFAGEVANFLKLLLSPLCQVLLTVPAEHDMGDRHRLRGTVLSILHRIPTNEALKPHAARMQEVCLQTLREDNEENAIVAIHMLFDLHKNFRPDLSAQARDFLEVVRLFYDGFPPNAAGYFGAEGVPPEMLRQGRALRCSTRAVEFSANTGRGWRVPRTAFL